jgi:HAMP domain-containing protein
MFKLISERLFGKVFVLIFLAIFIVLSIFTYQASILQKESILNSLQSESKTMADAITFLNKEQMIIDNQIVVLEFLNEFLNVNNQIETMILSRKNGNNIILKRNYWDTIENKFEIYDKSQIDVPSYEIVISPYVEKKVFKYTYPIYFSGVLWGWLHIDLSLDEYENKISQMYKQFIYLTIFMLFSSLILSFLIAKMVSKPIISLNSVSSEIAKGNLSIRANITTKDEIGILAKTFNNM